VKSASVFTGLHQSEWTKSRLFGHLAAFPSVSALAIMRESTHIPGDIGV
jgi:hypothetical protein